MTNIQRICCVCRVKQPITGMTRVVRIGDTYQIEQEHRLNGRGCYVCPGCLATAIAKKTLNRSFRTTVPENIYNQLASLLPNGKISQ